TRKPVMQPARLRVERVVSAGPGRRPTNDGMGRWGSMAETGATDDGGDGRIPVLYGVVRFEPGEERRVRDTTITFDSPAAAELFAVELFAVESGWDDYQVCPLFFFVDTATAPAAGRVLLGAALARSAHRAGGR
ncbi:hypothetical protein, partial [Frankia sp. Cr1]|uniref:hypothetical protein n=1 Tax=Frankia sp. Cr1 TaxID=3073931 RepID=UPI002AD55473